MGYDPPMDLTEAAWPGRAEEGGAALDTFHGSLSAAGRVTLGWRARTIGATHISDDRSKRLVHRN